MTLKGRVAIVTGGARGIGFSIARALASAGARVAFVSRTEVELSAARGELEKLGATVLAMPADVSREGDMAAVASAVVDKWDRIDVLVNNAGVYGAIGRLQECDPVEWRRAFEVNVFGTMLACRAVLPSMLARRTGKIINLAGGGVGGPRVEPRVSAYASSKAAVMQLTESLAREVGQDGIQVNAIAPGAVVTEMTTAVLMVGPEKAGKEFYERTVMQQRAGGDSPELAAKLAVWLASDASGPLTGKTLSAKWDRLEDLDLVEANRSSRYTLRRIDGVMMVEVIR